MKEKLIVLLIALVVLLVVCDMEAEASAIDYTPSYVIDNLTNYSVGATSKNYSIWVGADGMYLEVDESTHTWGVDSQVVTMDVGLGRGNYNLSEVNYTDYDYFEMFVKGFDIDVTLTNDYDSDVIQAMTSTLLNVKPYVQMDGEKFYIANDYGNSFVMDKLASDIPFLVGVELSILINYNGYELSDTTMASYYGSVDVNISRSAYNFGFNGIRYSSTGEEAIVDSVVSWGNILNSAMTSVKDAVNTQSNYVAQKLIDLWNKTNEVKNAITVTLVNKLTSVATTLTTNENTNFANTLSKLDAFMDMAQDNHDAMDALINEFYTDAGMWAGDIWSEIMWGFEDMRTWMRSHSEWLSSTYTEFKNDFQLKHETIVSKLDEIIETLTRGYDNPVGDNVDQKMDSDLIELDTAQKEVISGGVNNLDNFTVPSDGFNSFDPSFMGAFALVSGMLQSIFTSSGNFTVTMSVIFMLTVTTMVLGLFRYYKE